MITEQDIEPLRRCIEEAQTERMKRMGYDVALLFETSARTWIEMGKKYARVNVGTSGKYMVELETGRIFGIKGYGVIHRGHPFGTLETIDEWNWSEYRAQRRSGRRQLLAYPKSRRFDTGIVSLNPQQEEASR